MLLRAAVLVNIALTVLSTVSSVSGAMFFNQKLDHFNPSNKEYFKQRYYKRDNYFRDGAPIFLQIGGEGGLYVLTRSFVLEAARKNNGLFFALEHRYYGKSVPESYSNGIPTYLSSEQALEDIAHFIQYQKKFYPNNPWIVGGCSYAGNLATWMRLKYPHLVNGAIAVSAPVLAKANFCEFAEVVGELIKEKVPLCHQKLVEAIEELTALTVTSDGQRKLAKMFKTQEYSSGLVDMFRYTLGRHMIAFNDTGIHFLQYYESYNPEVCTSITRNNHGKSILEILINMLMHNQTSHSLELTMRKDITIGFRQRTALDNSMWRYQTCNEFGYFMTLTSEKQLFGVINDLDYYLNTCQEWNITSEMVKENIRKTNLKYGGKTPNVTNVVFMHGSNDPWSRLGLLSDLSKLARAFIFEGLSHCEAYLGREHFFKKDDRIPGWMQMFDEIESINRNWF